MWANSHAVGSSVTLGLTHHLLGELHNDLLSSLFLVLRAMHTHSRRYLRRLHTKAFSVCAILGGTVQLHIYLNAPRSISLAHRTSA